MFVPTRSLKLTSLCRFLRSPNFGDFFFGGRLRCFAEGFGEMRRKNVVFWW